MPIPLWMSDKSMVDICFAISTAQLSTSCISDHVWCNADLRAIDCRIHFILWTSVGIMFSDYMLNFGSPILGLGYAGVYSSSPTGLIMCWMQNIRIVRTSRRVAVLALTVPQRLKHSLCLDTIDHNRARQVASRNFAEEQRNRFSAVWADFRV